MRDPFQAIPAACDGVETRWDEQSRARLRREIPPGRGFSGFLARRFGFRRKVQVNLDERGSFFWSLIDGEKTLEHIEREVRRRFLLDEDESRKAVVMFVKMLMTRHWIGLKMSAGTSTER